MFYQFLKRHLLIRSNTFKFWFFTMLITLLSVVLFLIFQSNSVKSDDPIVKLPNGKIIGSEINIYRTSLYVYLGIPYALPANQYRFKPPVHDDRTWEKDKIAKSYGAGCPQNDKYIKLQNQGQGTGLIKYDEDCLFLNIWTPVYFNSTNPLNDKNLKSVFVVRDIIVVTLNYRLGILGFLYDGNEVKGNLGLMDQRLALEWVQKNIKQFGGDPNKVTICGESAGSWSVGIHLLLEKQNDDKQLFQNAIMMSGSPLSPALEEPEEIGLKKYELVLKRTNCKDLECLQKKSLKELMDLHFDQEIINLYRNTYRLAFQPVYGPNNGLIDKSSFQQLINNDYKVKNISLLIGNLVNEDKKIKDPKKSKEEYIDSLKFFINTTVHLDQSELDGLVANLDRFYFKEEILSKLKDEEELKESYEFSLQSSFYELLSDLVFVCPGKFYAENYFNKIQTENVYEYEISYESASTGSKEFAPWCEQNKFGPCHLVDLQYLFGRPFRYVAKYTQNDRASSFDIIRTFTNFAKTGSTNWKSYFKMKVKEDELIVPTEFEFNI